MSRRRSAAILLVVMVLGACLRLRGLDWDAHRHLHPDERFISMVDAALEDAGSVAEYLDSQRSPLNPYNKGFGSFVYGTLPLLLGRYVGRLVGLDGYDGAFLAGRALSALFDVLTISLTYRIGRRFLARPAALIAAALLAGSPLAIQLSHFWTVDTFLTTFVATALLGGLVLGRGGWQGGGVLLAGVGIGGAIACKVTGAAVLVPVGLALTMGLTRHRRPALTIAAGLATLAVAAIVVRLGLPYAFASTQLWSFRLDPRWTSDVQRLLELSGSADAWPPSYQWAGRSVWFLLRNLVLWGCSPSFGIPALIGLAWTLRAAIRRQPWANSGACLAVYVLLLVAHHGTTLVKAMRYLYPAYPALAVLAATVLYAWMERGAWPSARTRRIVVGACVAATLTAGYAFSNIYGREHTRVWASRWLDQVVLPPGPIGNETWDDSLPLPLPGMDMSRWAGPSLPIVDPDGAAKIEAIVTALSASDVIAVTSNRAYGSLTRLPAVFPVARAYYRALFDGALGFTMAADITSYPSLGPLRIADDSAEEAFTVYDHPRVLIFRKAPDFAPDRVRAVLSAALPRAAATLHDWVRWPDGWRRTVAPVSVPRSDVPGVRQEPPPAAVGSAIAWLRTYTAISLLGIAAWPLLFLAFPMLADRGFGFARLAGLVLVTLLARVAIWQTWVANSVATAWLAAAVLAAVALLALRGTRAEPLAWARGRWPSLAVHEAVFVGGFILFSALRALAPEIVWGEKPMDFSTLNLLLRTAVLPPTDAWFAGGTFNYYFFGQEMVAVLTQLTGLPSAFTYNLAFGIVGGTLAQGVYSLASTWGRRSAAGVAAGGLIVLAGNLSGPREWLVSGRKLDWDYFWATSRVIPDTVNEYPLWSLVFGDLHAHVLALPLLVLVLAAMLNLTRAQAAETPWRIRLGAAAVLGLSIGVHALTNAWDAPLLAGLALVVLPAALLLHEPWSRRRALSIAASTCVSGIFALAVAASMWPVGAGSPGVGQTMAGGRAVDVLAVFGLFGLLALTWGLMRLAPPAMPNRRLVLGLASAGLGITAFAALDVALIAGVVLFAVLAWRRAATVDERLACALAGVAFCLVLLPQHIYIADRLNTFFKLYLEAWVLFGIAVAVLVFGAPSGEPSPAAGWRRWPRPIRALAIGVAMMAAFTGVTAVRGAVSRHRGPYDGPSLDGLRYLDVQRPGEAAAARWLNRHVPGTPVLLEAQGPPYQDFARISMFTGLPTPLGWEHHVKQRGHAAAEVEARRDAVRAIYTTPDAAHAESLLRRLRVSLVYDGWLERETYPAEGLNKFREHGELFELIYENPEARIYRVRTVAVDGASR